MPEGHYAFCMHHTRGLGHAIRIVPLLLVNGSPDCDFRNLTRMLTLLVRHNVAELATLLVLESELLIYKRTNSGNCACRNSKETNQRKEDYIYPMTMTEERGQLLVSTA